MKHIYSNRSKNPLTWILVLFSMAYAIMALVIVVVVAEDIIKPTESGSKVMLILVPLLLCLVVWSLDLILWQITGKETVEITKEGLKVSHSGRVFRYRRFVPVTSIKKIINECNQSDVLRDFWVPQWQPKIKVVYNYNDSIRIGRNLSEAECSELLRELQGCYPGLKIEAELKPHKLTLNEILFIIWAVGCVFLFIPAWFVVPILQERHNNERIEKYTERMKFIRENYQKMYCYSTEYGAKCNSIVCMTESDSLYKSIYIMQCNIRDSVIHNSLPPIRVPNIMPVGHSVNNNIFAGVVYMVSKDEDVSLVYTNVHLYAPVFVLNRYLHINLPECKMSDCINDDISRLRWDETDDFIKNGSLWRLGIE